MLSSASAVRHSLAEIFTSEKSVSLSQEEGGGQKVLSCRNERFSRLWGNEVHLHSHQGQGFGFRFQSLREMEIHFVAVEVCIVGLAHAFVESEGA